MAQPAPVAPPQPRMPQIEEFSAPVQAAFHDRQREAAPKPAEDRSPVGLLRRLTSGLTRRDDETSSLQPAMPREASLRPAHAAEQRRVEPTASIYAPRRASEDEGRTVSAANNGDEDMLEIPAFLRRHAN